MPKLAVFTSPKPFTDPEIARIQRNALQSWVALGDPVEVLVIGDEPGAADAACSLGIGFHANVRRNVQGTPLISSIFATALAATSAPLLAYANADILLFQDLVAASYEVAEALPEFLLVGRRWDLKVEEDLPTGPGWQDRLRDLAHMRGRLHPPSGSDYFVFPRGCFQSVPDFAVGRAGWDNWMLFEARRRRWPLIDATERITVIHQEHDYRHLPGAQSHYRMPESRENLRLAGGRRTILTLADADWELREGGPARRAWSPGRWTRELELIPALRWGSRWLAHVAHAVFHPRKAWGEVSGWLAYKMGSTTGPGR